jgi:uncharacterized protein with HEPN domain
VKDDGLYIRHILECIRRVEENAAGGYDAFLASHTLQDAVLRNLQTMAESTQRLSPAVRAARAFGRLEGSLRFSQRAGAQLLGIELDRIWTIVENDVPTLKAALQNLSSSSG